MIIAGMFLLTVFSAFTMDFVFTVKYGKGWVSQGRSGTAFKEFIKEENGCVYFVDVWGTSVKTCGNYELKRY